jgi:Zn-dependent alcohol dehydrogenase
MLDGTTRLRFGGAEVHHYCFLSTFAERAVVPARSCVKIPSDVPFEVAALLGCAVTSGVGAVWRTAGVRPGERVAVIGTGGTGLSAVMGAVASGASQVIAVDRRHERERAQQLGATAVVQWQVSWSRWPRPCGGQRRRRRHAIDCTGRLSDAGSVPVHAQTGGP